MPPKNKPKNNLLWILVIFTLVISLLSLMPPTTVLVHRFYQSSRFMYYPFMVFHGGLVPIFSAISFIAGTTLLILKKSTAWILFVLGSTIVFGYWLYALIIALNNVVLPKSTVYYKLYNIMTYLVFAFWPFLFTAVVSLAVYRFTRNFKNKHPAKVSI